MMAPPPPPAVKLPSPELGVKPPAPGAAVSPAVSAARSGELNPNTYFADWVDGAPALWKAQNDDKIIAAKQGPPGPDGIPLLQMIPDKTKGWASLGYRVAVKDVGITAGDSILCEMEVQADVGVPMELRLRMLLSGQKTPAIQLSLPYSGEGVWRTLRLALTLPPGDYETTDMTLWVRGAQPGAVVMVRRASATLVPPV